MSIADLYNISRAVRRDKARQQNLLPTPSSSSSTVSARICNLCFTNAAKYNCPRCNIPFCSLSCFRSASHESCSQSFSTASLRQNVGQDLGKEEEERDKVLDILKKLETQDAERRTQMEEDDESSQDEDDGSQDIPQWDEKDIEDASPEQLLSMLTPKQRRKFEEATKNPILASKLMSKLERKASQMAIDSIATKKLIENPMKSPSSLIQNLKSSRTQVDQPDLILHGQQSDLSGFTDAIAGKGRERAHWQTPVWFEGELCCPKPLSTNPELFDTFAAELRKIFTARASSGQGRGAVDLTFNLAAVLMAYTFLLRHFDVESLASLGRSTDGLIGRNRSPRQDPEAAPSEPKAVFDSDEDEGPPPLEPDYPAPRTEIPSASGTSAHLSTARPEGACSREGMAAYEKLDRLVPFLTRQSPSSPNPPSASLERDLSKTTLQDVDDALMWLLSRFRIEEEVGNNMDALRLQLLQDLDTLLVQDKIVSLPQDEFVEPRFLLVFRLTGEREDRFLTMTSQHALVVNAFADLFVFLDSLADTTRGALSHRTTRLTQRKLSFYLVNTVLHGQQDPGSSFSRLRQQLQRSIEQVRVNIMHTDKKDKVAIASRLSENREPLTVSPPNS